jgi:hypothetical protein
MVRLARGGAGRPAPRMGMSIVPFIKRRVFDPQAIAVMSEAFDAACQELHDAGQPEIVLEVIAERIIELASTGELNPVRLREAALVGLAGTRD